MSKFVHIKTIISLTYTNKFVYLISIYTYIHAHVYIYDYANRNDFHPPHFLVFNSNTTYFYQCLTGRGRGREMIEKEVGK
jgi:hypothetical protein